MRLLVVEDDEKIAAFLRKGLAENGFMADVANTGDDGLLVFPRGETPARKRSQVRPRVS